MVLHDLVCANDHIVKNVDVVVQSGTTFGMCGVCGTPYEVSWAHGKAPATDVYGSEQTSRVLDVTYTSTRERDRKMRERGFVPGGDIRGGPMTQSGHLPRRLTPRGWEGRARFNPVED